MHVSLSSQNGPKYIATKLAHYSNLNLVQIKEIEITHRLFLVIAPKLLAG
jgi:hypothetical protein